jgi:hypothetical protein
LQLKKIATKIDSLLANFVTISHNKFSDSIVKNFFGSIARFKLDDGFYFGLFPCNCGSKILYLQKIDFMQTRDAVFAVNEDIKWI